MSLLGKIAPDFTLPRDGGGAVTLSACRPGNAVVYFYPKDSTPGCTTEAQDFSALAADFAACDCTVIGISKDSVKRHDNFRDKAGLALILASDAESSICEDWGVWAEKKLYGKTFMGIVRSTFLLDGAGQVVRIWSPVKVGGHAAEVLAAARAL
jgi:peroxiredoxin Q/BCP